MASPPLREVQRLFWRSVTERPASNSFIPTFVALVCGHDDAERKTRIQVYSDAYYLRLRDVLRDDFPQLAALLGLDRFDSLVKDYLEVHTSEHPSVRHLGRSLAEFLRRRRDLPGCAADLAVLEWARVEVFDAPDAECLGISDLIAIPAEAWPTLCFTPICALQTVFADYPVHQLCGDSEGWDVAKRRTSLRVWRAQDYSVRHTPMDERETTALEKLVAGEPFAAICGAFVELPETEATQQAGGLFARWIEDGIIASAAAAA